MYQNSRNGSMTNLQNEENLNNEDDYNNRNHQSNTPTNNRKKNEPVHRFNVIVRIRPQIESDTAGLSKEELDQRQDDFKQCVFKSEKCENKIILKNEKADKETETTFDRVLDGNCSQEEVYKIFCKKLVEEVLKGYNGTIMAYGQTGSGKSYTMFGKSVQEFKEITAKEYEKESGIVPRAIKQIFDYKNANKNKKNVTVNASFMQIYLNQIKDLFDEEHKDVVFNANKRRFKIHNEGKNLSIENTLKIGHDNTGKIYVKDLKIKEFDEEQKLRLYIEGCLNSRRTETTIMNKTSSRSHAILQITVNQRYLERIRNNTNGEVTENSHNLKSTLTFVDLAGSESITRTGSEGINLEEAKEINKSISALGRVIESLARQNKSNYKYNDKSNKKTERNNFGSKTYVSYRDSILTEILSECLGGNSKTYIIANVSPFVCNCEETTSTLNFASRAMYIRTQPVKNDKILERQGKDKNMNNKGYENVNNSSANRNINNKNIGGNKNRSVGKNGNKFNKLYNMIDKEKNNALEKKKEDYQAITKKFYSIILHLQEELGKITVENFRMEQENNFLREQLNNMI